MLARMDGSTRIGIVGAGRVGTALGVAISRAGWRVTGVASRDPARRARFLDLVPTARALADPGELAGIADVLLLTVPDDVIADVAAGLVLGSGQALVHTSGAQPSTILAVVGGVGVEVASFHPLVPFTDLTRAVQALHGATIAIEGDADLVGLLARLAVDLGANPMRTSVSGKAGYHAAAVLAAGGFVALLSAITELASVAGMDEGTALDVFGPLVRAGLANAEAAGVASALTGPFVRGDVGTVRRHLVAIGRFAPDARGVYLALAERQLALMAGDGGLEPERVAELRALLET